MKAFGVGESPSRRALHAPIDQKGRTPETKTPVSNEVVFVLYNVVNVAGWSYVLFHTLVSKLNNDTPCSYGGRLGWR